jgi:hypothetical protein
MTQGATEGGPALFRLFKGPMGVRLRRLWEQLPDASRPVEGR